MYVLETNICKYVPFNHVKHKNNHMKLLRKFFKLYFQVFSCQLIQKNETALSIIDPVTFSLEARQIRQTDLSQEEILSDPSILDKYVFMHYFRHVFLLNMKAFTDLCLL